MTNTEFMRLEITPDDEFKQFALDFGLEVEGPSARGAFLVRESTGKVWIFGSIRHMKQRVCVPSVWTPLNVAVMNNIN